MAEDGEVKRSKKNVLQQLKKMSTIVADTGNLEELISFNVTDATTNPSLLFKASENPKYQHLVDAAIEKANDLGRDILERTFLACDYLTVLIGVEILNIIPGRISTEVDPRLAFNKEKSVEHALNLVDLYEKQKVNRERILIKLPATWEGIQAAKELESKHNIRCNLTLVFSLVQAVACAEANVTLISPFVGRILDWHLANGNEKNFDSNQDPGVLSVTKIYNYLKKYDYKTLIMGASFRNTGQIKELAGCDLLTISPSLLDKLEKDFDGQLDRKLNVDSAHEKVIDKIEVDEASFRWMLNEDRMATEKLSEGIRKFADDARNLETMLHSRIKLIK